MEISALLGQTCLPSCGPFSHRGRARWLRWKPWMECHVLPWQALLSNIYIYNINTYACTRAKISILFWLYTYLLMKYTKALASCAAQLRWRRRRLRARDNQRSDVPWSSWGIGYGRPTIRHGIPYSGWIPWWLMGINGDSWWIPMNGLMTLMTIARYNYTVISFNLWPWHKWSIMICF